MPTDKQLISLWGEQIRRGESFRKKLYTNAHWRRFEGYFRNKFPGIHESEHNVESRTRIGVQTDAIISRETRKMVPKVIFGIPYLRVKPLAGRLPVHAKVLERVINGILDTIHINTQLRKLVLSASIHGTSFIKEGYDSEYAPSYKDVITRGSSDAAFDKKGKRFEFRTDIFPGMPWAIWQHPRNVVLPEMIESYESAQWIAFRYLRDLEDCKADKRLSNTADLQPVGYRYSDLDPWFSSEFPEYNTIKTKILLTEIRDKRSGFMYIFAEDHGQILYKEKDILMGILGGKLPAQQLIFNENTDYAYGTSDVEMVEPELKELIDLRTQHVKDRRLRILKFAYRRGAITTEELYKLTSSQVGAGVAVDTNVESAFKALDMPTQWDLTREEMDLERRIKQQFGANAFDTLPSSRRTSTEVGGSQQDALMPITDRQALVRQLVVEIGKDIANMVFNLWTEENVVDILAPVTEDAIDPASGQPVKQDVLKQVWVAFKGQELRGNFDYYIAPTAGRFQDAAESKNEAFEIIQFVSKIPGADLPELMRQLGDRFDGVDMEKIFHPMNNPNTPMQMNALQQMMGQANEIPRQRPQLPAGK